MELKKYVLLKDNRVVEIYKKEKFGYSYVDEVINDIVCTRSILISDVKKTSDNILDLVGVGDLVGYRFWGEDYENIDKMRDEQNINNDIKYNGNGFVIVAIYKRQTNGDYKRYEVK